MIALRVKVFEKVNGDNAITFPNAVVGPDRFQELYGHPAATGRSKGAGLSDLFWYWLSPGPEVHQEHLEAGPRYDDVAQVTRTFLAGPADALSVAAARCTAKVLDEVITKPVTHVRLRDLMMPVWAEYCYELVFGEPCPRAARDLIVGHADDVVTSLKCTGFRHPARRARLTRYLETRLADVRHPLPETLTRTEQVHYLQGTYFNTAVVQMSEAMAHLLLALAQHPQVAQRIDDDGYFAHVLDETFRLYPLFGIAHRITTADIELDEHTRFPAGSVLCFDYPAYHATGYAGSTPTHATSTTSRSASPPTAPARRGASPPSHCGRQREKCCAASRCTPPSRTPGRCPAAARACSSATVPHHVCGCG